MEATEFKEIFRQMIDTYSEKDYPGVRIQFFFKKFQNMDADIFQMAVDRTIANNKFAPMLDEFVVNSKEFIRIQADRDKAKMDERLEYAEDCEACQKRGSFIYSHWDRKDYRFYNTSLVCLCEAGRIMKPHTSLPFAMPLHFRSMIKPDIPSLVERTKALVAKGFHQESLIVARIVNQYIKGGDDTFLGAVKKHFGVKESDFFEINHEFISGVPGEWNDKLSKQNGLYRHRILRKDFLGTHSLRLSDGSRKGVSTAGGVASRVGRELPYDV